MSLSPNPLSPLEPGGRERRGWPLYILSVSGPRDRGHDCQSHPEDLSPQPPPNSTPPTLLPNSVSTCRLIKVLRIEEFVWETWSKSMSSFQGRWVYCGSGKGSRGGMSGLDKDPHSMSIHPCFLHFFTSKQAIRFSTVLTKP